MGADLRGTHMRGLMVGQQVLWRGNTYRVTHIDQKGRTMLYNGHLERANKTLPRRAAILAAVAWRRATR